MKKLCCMIALAAISFGSVYAEIPASHAKTTMSADTTMKKKSKKKMKDTTKMKKDTTKM
jgi:hypothetical protein